MAEQEKKTGNSIFYFEQQAGIDSPFGNWRIKKDAENTALKELSIKYIDCKTSEKRAETFELTFEVTAKNLLSTMANIRISILLPLFSPVTINRNGQTKITLPVPVPQKSVLPYMKSLKFTATVRCDGLNATSEEFDINGSLIPVLPCYCDRSFTVEEVANIVIKLREKTYYKKKNSIYSIYKEKLFHLLANVPKEDRTFEKFTQVLNDAFKKYNITKCSHKIHFLANMYAETMYFTTTKEFDNKYTKNYDPYRGRGFLHLTWEVNYKAYQKYSGIDIVTEPNYEKVADDLQTAADTAGWYWEKQNINSYAEKDSIYDTARLVNLPNATKSSQINGYETREAAWKVLKEIFEYPEQCVNAKNK
jgi:predicted chitinase